MMKKLFFYMYWGYMALFVLGTIQLHATTCYEIAQHKTVALEKIVKYLKKDESVLNGLDGQPSCSAFDSAFCKRLFDACQQYANKYNFPNRKERDYHFLSAAIIAQPSDRKKFSHWLFKQKILTLNNEDNDRVSENNWYDFKGKEKKLKALLEKELKELPGHLQRDYIEEWRDFVAHQRNPDDHNDKETKEKKEIFFGVLNELTPKANQNAAGFWKGALDQYTSLEKGEMIFARQIRSMLGDTPITQTFAPFDIMTFLQRGFLSIVVITIFYWLFSYGWLSLDFDDEY